MVVDSSPSFHIVFVVVASCLFHHVVVVLVMVVVVVVVVVVASHSCYVASNDCDDVPFQRKGRKIKYINKINNNSIL